MSFAKKLGLICVSAIAGLLGTVSFGDIKGNGGHVVVCDDRPLQLLDHWEAIGIRGLHLLGAEGLNHIEIIHQVLDRLADFDFFRANQYRLALEEIQDPAKTKIIPISLESTEDSEHVGLPEDNCFLRQAAVHFLAPKPGEPTFIFAKQYWERLSAVDKAGLVLHELIYREAATNGTLDSAYARWLNILISTDQLDSIGLIDYQEYLKPSPFGFAPAVATADGHYLVFLDPLYAEKVLKHESLIAECQETDFLEVETSYAKAHWLAMAARLNELNRFGSDRSKGLEISNFFHRRTHSHEGHQYEDFPFCFAARLDGIDSEDYYCGGYPQSRICMIKRIHDSVTIH